MSCPACGAANREALEKVIADNGVSVNADDVDAVARSLERIQSAAATLLQSLIVRRDQRALLPLARGRRPDGAGR